MKRFMYIMLLTLGFGLLAALSPRFSTPSTIKAAGSAPVTVTNTPLPVMVNNFPAGQTVSGTVAVSNFPATQPVSGTVTANITGTPAVTLSSTASTPVFVDANGPARSPAFGSCSAPTGVFGDAGCNLTINSTTVTTVPSGEVLVTDTVSVLISLATGSKVGRGVELFGNLAPGEDTLAQHIFVPPTLTATNYVSSDSYQFAGPVTLYVSAGKELRCLISTTDTSQSGQISCFFTGHLVAVPAS
jgi:hypothetical protein